MRRTPPLALVTSLLVLAVGCGEGPASGPDAPGAETTAPSTAAPPTAASSPAESEPEVDDTFADVAEPASLPLDADLLDGVSAVSVWKGAELLEDEGLSTAEIKVPPGRPAAVTVLTRTQPLARDTAAAERRYWMKRNTITEGPIEVLDPVVVDGAELQRARGRTILDLVVDRFFHATGEVSVEVQFLLPAELSEAERENYIGQVMATLDLDLE